MNNDDLFTEGSQMSLEVCDSCYDLGTAVKKYNVGGSMMYLCLGCKEEKEIELDLDIDEIGEYYDRV